uniref:AB hydrolase-1 domain-containing protein n=1 Tax=Shewanella hanedai TaxID=25 RepID=A0ZSG8_SHEHA|nr:hypothetical protein [Shewanella hanedai]
MVSFFISAFILVLLISLILIYFTPLYLYQLLTHTTRYLSGLSRKEITLLEKRYVYLDNANEHYQINSKPILLMLHGFTANKDNWLQMSLFLKKKYRIIALDLLGHGESDAPLDADYCIEAQVKRVHLFVSEQKLAPFHILGSSMGGQIAATYAALFPEEILSVTLFDNAGIDSPIKSDMFQDLASNRPNPLIDCTNPIEYFNYTFYKSGLIPKSLKQTHLALQAHKKQLHHKIFADFHNNDLLPYLDKIQVPVLIVWGEEDRILDKSALDKICPLLSNVQVVLLKNIGHLPMVEVPKKSAALFNKFVKQLDVNNEKPLG